MSYSYQLPRGPFTPPPPHQEESSAAIAAMVFGPAAYTSAVPETSAALNPVLFGNAAYDSGGFVVGNDESQFVAPSDGLYLLNLALFVEFDVDPGNVLIRVRINGNGSDADIRQAVTGTVEDGFGAFTSYPAASGLMRLLQGEIVFADVEVYCTNAVTITISQDSRQQFSIIRVSDYPSDIE